MKGCIRLALGVIVILLALAAPGIPARAQDGGAVTDDDVNNVAKKLYCPICENVPLDTCGAAACIEWRQEIRALLQEGATEREVIDSFVARFGDRVVGTPQDPTLRALSLVTPWVISAVILLVAVWVFVRWRLELAKADGAALSPAAAPTDQAAHSIDEYRARLEHDLAQRR